MILGNCTVLLQTGNSTRREAGFYSYIIILLLYYNRLYFIQWVNLLPRVYLGYIVVIFMNVRR